MTRRRRHYPAGWVAYDAIGRPVDAYADEGVTAPSDDERTEP